MSSMIDKVLQEAVDAGAVPSVAAIAADRNSIIYEGDSIFLPFGPPEAMELYANFERAVYASRSFVAVLSLPGTCRTVDGWDLDKLMRIEPPAPPPGPLDRMGAGASLRM